MILGTKHDVWVYELQIINALVKLEDVVAVSTPITLNVQHTPRYPRLYTFGAFLAGFLPVIASIIIGGLL